jgi:hypothetical protein
VTLQHRGKLVQSAVIQRTGQRAPLIQGERLIESVTTDDVLSFLTGLSTAKNQPPSATGIPVSRPFLTSSRIQ